jgi:hypothetical protein
MCHVQSLEKDFDFNALGSFDHAFTHSWFQLGQQALTHFPFFLSYITLMPRNATMTIL